MVNFRFSEGSLARVKHAALKQIVEAFQRWKLDLNKRYIQKGLTPFNEFSHITPSQWEDLMAQKTTLAALALSARNTELAKKNVYRHHLGPDAYRLKEAMFRKMEEEADESRAYN